MFDTDTHYNYIKMEVAVTYGTNTHPVTERVTKRLRDNLVNTIGVGNPNPILDTWMYEVEFSNGNKKSMSANRITEFMFS